MPANTPEAPINIFISYPDDDKKIAGQIKDGLELLGFTCFLAHENITAGKWLEQIDHALEKCDVFLVLLTDAAKKSAWVHQECGAVHLRNVKMKQFRKHYPSIIPLKNEYDPQGCMAVYQAHKLRFGFWGGLTFDKKDIFELSKKFVDEIKEKNKARKYALELLMHASAHQAELILDFALWTSVPFDDAKFILKCAGKNKRMAQSNDVYHSLASIYNHEPFKPGFDQDVEITGYWKQYQKAVKKRQAEEARRAQIQSAAMMALIDKASENLDRQQKGLSENASNPENNSENGNEQSKSPT